MGKSRFVAATALLGLAASAFSVPAMADSFSGVCTLSGTATLTPALGPIPTAGTGFNFSSNANFLGGAANVCSGVLNGVPVANVTTAATASGTGTLSCSASASGTLLGSGSGSGTLTIAGADIGFSLNFIATGPQVTLAIIGNVGGAATGQATFAADTTAAGKCATSTAGSLEFLVGAAAANLSD